MDQEAIGGDPIQLASTLKAFAELRQNNAISDDDYDRLKARVLAAVEQRVTPQSIPPPQAATATPDHPQDIQDFAGDLHRIVAEKLAQDYPSGEHPPQDERKRYLTAVAALLIEKQALHPSDMSHMAKVIETAMDESYAASLARLAQGFAKLSAIHNEARLSANSSPLCKTISAIGRDSAEKAVEMEAVVPAPSGSDTAQQEQQAQTRRSRWWGAVMADVTGAFTAASTAATILAGPCFPIASLAVLGALGPAAAAVPVLSAVVGAGMLSGMERARTR